MINLQTNQIELNGLKHYIDKYVVWWAVPGHGLFSELELALNTGGTVQGVPVALARDGMYEVLPPEFTNEDRSNA